jgi:hypothetical protein
MASSALNLPGSDWSDFNTSAFVSIKIKFDLSYKIVFAGFKYFFAVGGGYFSPVGTFHARSIISL